MRDGQFVKKGGKRKIFCKVVTQKRVFSFVFLPIELGDL